MHCVAAAAAAVAAAAAAAVAEMVNPAELWRTVATAALPPILGFSGHEIKGVADHLGGFRAWIPERSD